MHSPCTALTMHCSHYALHSLCTALTIHCTHHALHSLCTALTMHCTHYALHSLCTALTLPTKPPAPSTSSSACAPPLHWSSATGLLRSAGIVYCTRSTHYALHSLCTALTIHCTHHTLHSPCTALTMHCTHYALHSLCTALTHYGHQLPPAEQRPRQPVLPSLRAAQHAGVQVPALYCAHYTVLTVLTILYSLYSLYCTHCTHCTVLTILYSLYSLYCTHYTILTVQAGVRVPRRRTGDMMRLICGYTAVLTPLCSHHCAHSC
jgi:hypothetical protein